MKTTFSSGKFYVLFSLLFFVTGIIYIVLMLPLFKIGPVMGVGDPSWPPNGWLSNFEIVWQPVCAILYFVASWGLIMHRPSKIAGADLWLINSPLIASLIEALTLNVYQIIATRVSSNFVDGIFTSHQPYSLLAAAIYIALPIIAIILVDHLFAKSRA